MKGERLYERIEVDHHAKHIEMGPTMAADELALARVTTDAGICFRLYYFGSTGCEAFLMSEEAARQLRDQLNEALAEKPQAPVSWISWGIPYSGVGTSRPLLAGCTCGRPWMSTAPPPPCPVHGPAQTLKMTCED